MGTDDSGKEGKGDNEMSHCVSIRSPPGPRSSEYLGGPPDDSEITPPLRTPKPDPFVGMLPSTPPPPPIETNKLARQQKQLLGILRSLYPNESARLAQNGNANPVLQHHLRNQKDDLLMEIEGNTKFFFRIPMKYAVIGATILTLAAAGLAVHSCSQTKELEQRIEQLEKQKPKKTSYLPRCLRNPPKPNQKLISRRPIRRA
ncbi:MAG: hypothetical protein GY852_10425 [bacterium]|nr:hypothetical protein [bacterium]